jgi:hypothetical protein
MSNLDSQSRFTLAYEHFMHRKYAVEAQAAAYARWAEIEKQSLCERTPGEEHYIMCMKAWEERYKPFRPHHDYDCDAGIMLFNVGMDKHEEAAQALIALEEQRRLRQNRLFVDANPRLTMPMGPPLVPRVALKTPPPMEPAAAAPLTSSRSKKRKAGSPVAIGAATLPANAKKPKAVVSPQKPTEVATRDIVGAGSSL